MMGKIYLKQLYFLLTLVLISLSLLPSYALAQASCTLQNTFPSSMNHPVSEAGDRRISSSKGQYKHTGNDFFYPDGQKIVVPQGCQIQNNSNGNMVWEQNSKKANGEPAGYGYYMVLDCGIYGGDTLKMMLAHVPKNPYNASTKEILMGTSGNAVGGAPHYHVEVMIGNRRVDPQCVLGIAKTNQNADEAPAACLTCPNVGPADLCSDTMRNNLINHGGNCFGAAAVKGLDGGSTVDPDRIRGSGVTATADATTPSTGIPNGDGGGDQMKTDDLTGGIGSTPAPPEADFVEDPPIEPPPTPVPGVPTGAPNLAPPPATTTGTPATGTATTPPAPVSGCAADTWTAMVNQAVMETRREDMLNKRFIVKPDSVLDYSCFGQQLKNVGENAGPLFSETEKWNFLNVDLIGEQVFIKRHIQEETNDPFFSEKGYNFEKDYTMSNGQAITYKLMSTISLNMAIDNLVIKASQAYLANNFNSTDGYLAGSTPVSGVDPATCNVMSAVWQAAKCKNFDGADMFYSFEDLTTNDPREFPPSMRCF